MSDIRQIIQPPLGVENAITAEIKFQSLLQFISWFRKAAANPKLRGETYGNLGLSKIGASGALSAWSTLENIAYSSLGIRDAKRSNVQINPS